MGLTVEPARERGALEVHASITGRVSPSDGLSAEALEHALAVEPGTLFLLARLDGEPVASGVGKLSSVPGLLYAMARVLPECRRLGAGTAIYRAVSDHARAMGRERLFGRVQEDDEASLAFVTKRGFEETGLDYASALHLARHEPAAPGPAAGVEVHSLEARPDLVEGAWQVERECVGDVPAPEPMEPPTWEKWAAANVNAHGYLPAGSFVAVAGGEVVGYAGLCDLDGQPGNAENLLTAVRPAWRGRGIARAMKAAQAAWAKQAGFERLLTYNADENAAMRAVNARLGYEREPGWISVRGPLSATGR